MNTFILLAFLFFMGSLIGWCLEVVYRRFFSGANPERRWINPGFLTGPYLPLYGFGLTLLYLIACCEPFLKISDPVLRKIELFIVMAAFMTIIEYIAGVIFIRGMKIKLWDYSEQWGNVQGIVCPLFSFFWAVLGAVYYFLVHPRILGALDWLSRNLTFSFVIGFFYGVFMIDFANSTQLMVKLRRFAAEKQIVIRYEEYKEHTRQERFAIRARLGFFFSAYRRMHSDEALSSFYEQRKKIFDEIRERRARQEAGK